VYDADGAPLDPDNSTVVRERISLEKADPNILRNEITTIDDALTRPWTVTRTYRRHPAVWNEYVCAATNEHLRPTVMLAPIASFPSQHAHFQSPLAKLVAQHSEPTIPAGLS